MEAETNREEQWEKVELYFSRYDAPRENSPVGVVMVKVLEKFPGISLEDARAKAKELLYEAARKNNFRMPVVLTDQEKLEQKERIRAAFARTAVLV